MKQAMQAPPVEYCDILIIGSGPAGMAAALAAAPSGAYIVIIDDNPAPGGQIWRDGPAVQLPAQATQMRSAIAAFANIEIVMGTRVIDAPLPKHLLLENAERGWLMRWKKIILCTGARELLLPFPGWTLPGVTGAGALQALIKSGMPVAGERIVISGSGPLLLAAAASATKAGAQVVRIAEQASLGSVLGFGLQLLRWPGKLVQSFGLFNATYRAGSHVVSAQGSGRVNAVHVKRGDGAIEELACDRVACGFGLVPNTELGQLLGCNLVPFGGTAALAVDASQRTTMADIYAAGECTGIGGSDRAQVQGTIAGHACVGNTAAAESLRSALLRWNKFASELERRFALADDLRTLATPETLVCRCEDVTQGALADRSGWIDAKLHTRCGMGACQGRICGAAAQVLYGWAPQPARHLLSPARLSTLASAAPDFIHEPMTESTSKA